MTRLHPYDNPGSVRVRKYLTGSYLVADHVDVAQTPSEIVWTLGAATLRRYRSPAIRFPLPVVVVYAFILRPYILDLVPGRSFVEFLSVRGFDVFLLDWGDANAGRGGMGFEESVAEALPQAVDTARGMTDREQVTLLGHCQGGTMASISAALRPAAVRNLILLAAPIDFAPRRPGLAGAWTLWSRHRWYDPGVLVDAAGRVPAHVPSRVLTAALAPARWLTTATGAGEQLRAHTARDEDARAWLGACRWVDDAVALPGAGFTQWIRDFYQSNDLVAGRFRAGGRPVALADVTAEVLVVTGAKDVIAPQAQNALPSHFPGARSYERLLVDAGHVGLVVGPTAPVETWQPIRDWLLPRSHGPAATGPAA